MTDTQVFIYQGQDICFQNEGDNIMINATEMAKPFARAPYDFLRLKSTLEFINAYRTAKGIPEAASSGLVETVNGGANYGTWMHRDIALEFARWLSPAFAIWCNDRIYELMKHGFTATDNKLEELLADPDLVIGLANQLKSERAKNLLNVKQIELLEEVTKQQAPKVLFADSVASSNKSILIGELAKIICQNGYQIGQNRLFGILRQKGYLGVKGDYYNLPTQMAMNLGLFEIKKTSIDKPDGTILVTSTTKVTGKGQIYFVNKFIAKVTQEA